MVFLLFFPFFCLHLSWWDHETMREIKGALRQQNYTTHHPKENPCRNEDDVRHYPLQRYPLQPSSAWVAGNKHPTKWQRRPECKPSSTILSSDPWCLPLLLGRFYHHHPPMAALSSQQRTQQMEGNKWRKCQSSQAVEREIVQRFNPSWGRLNTTRLGWFTRTHPSRLDEIWKWQIADDDTNLKRRVSFSKTGDEEMRCKNSCECLAIHQPTADMTVSSV